MEFNNKPESISEPNSLNCLRCGQCCYYFLNGIKKKCKFLVILQNKKTLCRIYKTRENKEIDTGVYCTSRISENLKFASYNPYKNCPCNN